MQCGRTGDEVARLQRDHAYDATAVRASESAPQRRASQLHPAGLECREAKDGPTGAAGERPICNTQGCQQRAIEREIYLEATEVRDAIFCDLHVYEITVGDALRGRQHADRNANQAAKVGNRRGCRPGWRGGGSGRCGAGRSARRREGRRGRRAIGSASRDRYRAALRRGGNYPAQRVTQASRKVERARDRAVLAPERDGRKQIAAGGCSAGTECDAAES
jgi:hypothetical protein